MSVEYLKLQCHVSMLIGALWRMGVGLFQVKGSIIVEDERNMTDCEHFG